MADPTKSMKITPANPKNRNVPWFIADGHNGFTSNPDFAIKDVHGNPVLAPGEMNRVWNAEYARIQRRRDKIWGYLLDRMEDDIILAERQEKAVIDGDTMKQRYVKRERITNRGVQHGLKLALAELELPENRASDIEEDIKWVEKRAQLKYEQESE